MKEFSFRKDQPNCVESCLFLTKTKLMSLRKYEGKKYETENCPRRVLALTPTAESESDF